jgi:uncharacterized membrane protein
MLWIAMVVHWLHVFFAIVWFGGTLFMFAVVTPALTASSPEAAAEVGAALGLRTTRVLGPAGGLTILFGIVSATVFGPVRSLAFLWSSAYGVTVAVAFIVAIVLAVEGTRMGKVGQAIAAAPQADRPRLIQEIVRMAGVSVLGFIIVLTCMVLMHDGL